MVNFDQEIRMAKDNAKGATILECHVGAKLLEIRAKIWQARKDGNVTLANKLQDEYTSL